MKPSKEQIESALKSKETNVTSSITVSIKGTSFLLTRSQAVDLRDQLNAALGESQSRPLFPDVPPKPWTIPPSDPPSDSPYRTNPPWERPWWGKEIIYCTR